jgi:hypothetical protein
VAGFQNNACIARFDQQLHFIAGKQIIGAEGRFPIVFHHSSGVNLLSYYFSKTRRGVAAALDGNLQPIDTACSWIKNLHLAMAQCSYKTTDVESSEENLEVTVAEGASHTQPTELKLVPLDLHITIEGRQKSAEQ